MFRVSLPLTRNEIDSVAKLGVEMALKTAMRSVVLQLCIVRMCIEPLGHNFLLCSERRSEHPRIKCFAFWGMSLTLSFDLDHKGGSVAGLSVPAVGFVVAEFVCGEEGACAMSVDLICVWGEGGVMEEVNVGVSSFG